MILGVNPKPGWMLDRCLKKVGLDGWLAEGLERWPDAGALRNPRNVGGDRARTMTAYLHT